MNESDPRVQEYKAKLDALETKAKDLESSARAEYEESRNYFSEILDRWTVSTKDTWETVKGEADAAWTALEQKAKEIKKD